MIDLHMHSTFSDGELIPSEVVSRALFAGYTHLAITDHVDPSNVENVVERMVHVCSQLRGKVRAQVYPGVEITHVPPRLIAPLAAIRAKVNILAHPGLLSEEEATLARKNGVLLEITARKGHSLTNGHVARMAMKTGARLVYNTDSHSPGDFTPWEAALQIIRGSGLTEKDAARMQANARELVER
ncbi:MAG: putative phosphatase, PHP family [Deltaproteobacteria bacterium CSP1-8]|nr:MAG: putative phosphatase, PHP family [Deltaproteobacteria bacterium CSP1-8]